MRVRRAASGEHERQAAQERAAHTGRKTESARQPGPVLRAAGRTPVPPRRRWVPPSSLRHHEVPDGDAKYDVIFRKVRFTKWYNINIIQTPMTIEMKS